MGRTEIGCEGLNETDKRQVLVSKIFVNMKAPVGSMDFLSRWVTSYTFQGKASSVELICVIEWIKLHEVWWLWNFGSNIIHHFTVMITQNSLEYSPYTPAQRTVVAASSVSPIGHEDVGGRKANNFVIFGQVIDLHVAHWGKTSSKALFNLKWSLQMFSTAKCYSKLLNHVNLTSHPHNSFN